jgi:CBS domain containing-hemolysin-like protein
MYMIGVVVCFCLVGSFLCSIMEASLYSISRARIETLRRQGDRKGDILALMREHIDEPIAAILILNTIANTGGAAYAGALVAEHYGHAWLGAFSASLTLSILFFSEIVPKSLGYKFAGHIAPALAWPLRLLVFVLYPAVKLCVSITNSFGRRSRLSQVPEDDIISLASLSMRSGSIRMQEARWVANALHLDKVVARDLMTPLTVVRRVSADMPLKMTRTDADHWRFSRIPVFSEEKPEEVVGVVQRRIVFQHLLEGKDELRMRDIMSPPIFVSDDSPAHELLNLFIKHRRHLFNVRTSAGKWIGIVTLEDVLEALLGTEIVGEQDLYEDMQEAAIEAEMAQGLTDDLRRGGGTIEQVVVVKRSPVVGRAIRDSGIPSQAIVGPIVRDGTVIVPRGDILLQEGDRVTLIGKKEAVEEAKRRLHPGDEPKENESV